MTDVHHRKIEELTLEQVTIKHSVSDLELQLQASLASTHNGSFLWRIPDFSKRRREGIEEKITSIYSPPFYTGRWGGGEGLSAKAFSDTKLPQKLTSLY